MQPLVSSFICTGLKFRHPGKASSIVWSLAVSEIIKGPNERYWVIKLVDKMVDPKITFDTEKEKIVEVLRKQKADELYETMLSQMRTKSKIIFPK
jgi:hypothetical protein